MHSIPYIIAALLFVASLVVANDILVADLEPAMVAIIAQTHREQVRYANTADVMFIHIANTLPRPSSFHISTLKSLQLSTKNDMNTSILSYPLSYPKVSSKKHRTVPVLLP